MKKQVENTNILKPMYVRNVPEPMRMKFRVACVVSGYAMQDVIVACMRYLDTSDKIKEFMK
jgi:hypothetical protein